MKKTLFQTPVPARILAPALALVLVLALGHAAPVLAYTGIASNNTLAGGTTVAIQLIDYSEGGQWGANFAPPAANRRYAKNEIVAVLVSITVPADVDLSANGLGYTWLYMSGENISVSAAENNFRLVGTPPKTIFDLNHTFAITPTNTFLEDNTLKVGLNMGAGFYCMPMNTQSTVTYKVLYFAKITGGDAVLTATLSKRVRWWSVAPRNEIDPADLLQSIDTGYYIALFDDYVVKYTKAVPPTPTYYTIFDGSEEVFTIMVDKSSKTTGLRVHYGGSTYEVDYVGGAYYFTNLATIKPAEGMVYSILVAMMDNIFNGDLRLDLNNEGNIMGPHEWADYANSFHDVNASINIDPLTPYVTIP